MAHACGLPPQLSTVGIAAVVLQGDCVLVLWRNRKHFCGSMQERFAELDQLQPGWTVELRQKGETIEAVFFHPSGEKAGAYANARRAALVWHKANVL